MNIKSFFNIISYLQYPLLLLSLIFVVKPFLKGMEYLANNKELFAKDFNYVLIFMGLAISFSTLQDTDKMQNKMSKRTWENPKKGKRMIGLLSAMVIVVLGYGIFGYFITDNEGLKELSFGAIVLGIGLIGFLKTAIEIFEKHRIDTK